MLLGCIYNNLTCNILLKHYLRIFSGLPKVQVTFSSKMTKLMKWVSEFKYKIASDGVFSLETIQKWLLQLVAVH